MKKTIKYLIRQIRKEGKFEFILQRWLSTLSSSSCRSGIPLERLDNLSVIHVAGTKGKGSVCAFAESLLRAHGVRTGLYTSPHLVSVRERLRINGKPIDEEMFTSHFWKVYDRLDKGRDYDGDMPQYFKFLTLLMFHVFLEAPIDVAIIEVGIGGELDCTNVVRRPVCVGITSLGLEHTNLLGDTLESIAYQKSGIFKSGAPALSVPQPEEAMSILDKRSQERGCSLAVVPGIDSYPWTGKRPVLGIEGEFQNYNASIAIGLARTWLESSEKRTAFSFETAASALSRCKWPGRTQVLRGDRIDFYLDGAHTIESMECCASWYSESTKNLNKKRILLFNTTGNRDAAKLLALLRPLNFQRAFFVPNVAGKVTRVDQINYTVSGKEQIERCQYHCDIWGEGSVCGSDVSQVLDKIAEENESGEKINLLVTGSLHLVGAVLAIIDPDLTMSARS